jgi:hypothetical protein
MHVYKFAHKGNNESIRYLILECWTSEHGNQAREEMGTQVVIGRRVTSKRVWAK